MKKINLNFKRYADAILLIIAQAIAAALTGNAYFPPPTPPLPFYKPPSAITRLPLPPLRRVVKTILH